MSNDFDAMTKNKSKAELIQTIQDLLNEIERMKEQLGSQAAISKGRESGWLITTPNKNYNGRVSGISFEAGKAFVPENMAGAEMLVTRIASDFGYEVEKIKR